MMKNEKIENNIRESIKISKRKVCLKFKEITNILSAYSIKHYPEYYFLQTISNLPEFKDVEKMIYIPDPYEIAQFYGIPYKFVKIKGDILSYYEDGVIYISDKYNRESIKARFLCAHEVAHFIIQGGRVATMWNRKNASNVEIMNEYEANIFAIKLMPQFMCNIPWKKLSPEELNKCIYEKLL